MPEQGIERVENLDNNIAVVKAWDKTAESLDLEPGLSELVQKIGFTVTDLVAVLNKDFPEDAKFQVVNSSDGVKIEDVATEAMTVDGKPLDRLLVIAYPPAAKQDLKIMTRFKVGGEVILIKGGRAELTYASKIFEGIISKGDLKTIELEQGDLVISSDVPNNWSRVVGDSFSFSYLVGNPDGNQRYDEVPKYDPVPVK
jgi:hypothetical protein